jgi:uncharacterized delta-60 repeat protein
VSGPASRRRHRSLRLEALEDRTLLSAGALDLTFGNGGTVTTPIGSSTDAGNAAVIDLQGRIVVAGYALIGSDFDFAVARYNPNGTLDTSFNGTGKRTVDVAGNGHDDFIKGIVLDSQGRIVAAGFAFNGTADDFAVARFLPDGNIDTSFNNGQGFIKTSLGSNAVANAVALDSQGRIILAGYALVGSDDDFALIRYTSNGAVDTSFGNNGHTTSDLSGFQNDIGQAVAIDLYGNIVVAGQSVVSGHNEFSVARYTANGSLDMTFGTNGHTFVAIGFGNASGNGLAVDADDRVVVAGVAFNGTNTAFAATRLIGSNPPSADFDQDGNVDLLWRQSSSGQVWIWRLNGTQLASVNPFVHITDSPAGTDWQVMGVGDFDKDGNLDLLWRQTSTGQVWIWRLNGTALASSNPFIQITTSPAGDDWLLRGVGDFDHDGNLDLVWRQTSTGQVWIWKLKGTSVAPSNPYVHITDSPAGLDWQIF